MFEGYIYIYIYCRNDITLFEGPLNEGLKSDLSNLGHRFSSKLSISNLGLDQKNLE